jgi:L-seryl-tRNA(Ser) seleniumtransferase
VASHWPGSYTFPGNRLCCTIRGLDAGLARDLELGSAMSDNINETLRRLPSVDSLLSAEDIASLIARYGRGIVVRASREVLEEARARIRAGSGAPAALVPLVEKRVNQLVSATLVPVINATGVVIHTNLGRAPLAVAAMAEMGAVGGGYSNLEFDIASGKRGSRYDHVAARLAELSGAEAALVVNNNAAALVLVLATLAAGREVVVSRAQLVEIGGGFRIPDIMRQSGAILREVGTTNRTYTHDYTGAVGDETAMFLHVHSSNFRVVGFVHQPSVAELAPAAHARGLVVVDDVGSGALLDTSRFGMAKEPMVQESIAAGADLVLFSGDKLLGGPQAGCIAGTHDLINELRRHPLARALRVDKTTLAALDATLGIYLRDRAIEEIPVWRMIARSEKALEEVTRRWENELRQAGITAQAERGLSTVGGGSLPGETLPTWLLRLPDPHPDARAAALREYRPAVIARIEKEHLLVDPRTVLPEQEHLLLEALVATHHDVVAGS